MAVFLRLQGARDVRVWWCVVAQLDRAPRLADLDRLNRAPGLINTEFGARRVQVQVLPTQLSTVRDALMNTGLIAFLHAYAKTYWLLPFLISVIVGGYPAKWLTEHLYRGLEKLPKADDDPETLETVRGLTACIGYVERAFITALVIWLPESAGTAMAGLLALKMAGGWGALKNGSTRTRAAYSIGLIGSLLSFMSAIAFGLLAAPWWLKP
jgi:hypothetical protein